MKMKEAAYGKGRTEPLAHVPSSQNAFAGTSSAEKNSAVLLGLCSFFCIYLV